MKIKVDKENKVVVAYGSCKGKRIKVKAVCKEPNFDIDFGISLVKKKYNIKYKYVQMKYHESEIKRLMREKNSIESMIEEHNKHVEKMDTLVLDNIKDCENFINDYFNK